MIQSAQLFGHYHFESTRNLIGNLILLTRDKNRSYQAMKYSEKVQKYAGDNILAQALSSTAYSKNPSFLSTVVAKYGFPSRTQRVLHDFIKAV